MNVTCRADIQLQLLTSEPGDVVPMAPRPSPPPTPARPNIPEKAIESVAITPWQKTTREVAIVTGGMGLALTLGKLSRSVIFLLIQQMLLELCAIRIFKDYCSRVRTRPGNSANRSPVL